MCYAEKIYSLVRKLKLVLICAVALAGTLTAQAETKKTKILVACDFDFPPLSFVSDTGIDGFDSDYLNVLAENQDLEIEIVPLPWEQALEALRAGTVDVVSGIIKNPKRQKEFTFSIPYIVDSYSMYTQKDSQIQGLGTLSGKKLAFRAGDVAIDTFVGGQNLAREARFTQSFSDAFALVDSGLADYTIAPSFLGEHKIAQGEYPHVAGTGRTLFLVSFRFAVLKGRSDLILELNEGIQRIEKLGTNKKLKQKWGFATGFVFSENPTVSSLFIGIIVGALVALAGGGFWFLLHRVVWQKKIETLLCECALYEHILDRLPIGVFWKGEKNGMQYENSAFGQCNDLDTEQKKIETKVIDLRAVSDKKVPSGTLTLKTDVSCEVELAQEIREKNLYLQKQHIQIIEESITDLESGLFNKQYLKNRIKELNLRKERSGEDFAILLLTVNAFIIENDCIRSFARMLEHIARKQDSVGYLGIGSFCIILPDLKEGVMGEYQSRIAEMINDFKQFPGSENMFVSMTAYPEDVRVQELMK